MTKKRTALNEEPSELKVMLEPVENLRLDPSNPRLLTVPENPTQEELVQALWKEFAVDEVALSIAANGYFQEEPLLVVPEDKAHPEGPFLVVEGNRRFAAVLLLRSKELRDKVRATNLPDINDHQRAQLDKLPVSKYSEKSELWQHLGFRHINGPQPWDSFSKAKFVADVHDSSGVSLDRIADSIGDRHSTVKRLYRGYNLIMQAESQTKFKRADRIANKFFFSHLYTAADQPEFQKFIGIDPEKSLKSNPVPKDKLNELEELMIWLYGSQSQKKQPLIQTQNPDLNTLREVLSDPKGVDALRAGRGLKRSHEISLGDERRFRDALIRAKDELQTANGILVTGYSGQEDIKALFQDILKIVDAMDQQIQSKQTKRNRSGHRG